MARSDSAPSRTRSPPCSYVPYFQRQHAPFNLHDYLVTAVCDTLKSGRASNSCNYLRERRELTAHASLRLLRSIPRFFHPSLDHPFAAATLAAPPSPVNHLPPPLSLSRLSSLCARWLRLIHPYGSHALGQLSPSASPFLSSSRQPSTHAASSTRPRARFTAVR